MSIVLQAVAGELVLRSPVTTALSGFDDGQDGLVGVHGQCTRLISAAPVSDVGGRGSDPAGCTPGLRWGDWGSVFEPGEM